MSITFSPDGLGEFPQTETMPGREVRESNNAPQDTQALAGEIALAEIIQETIILDDSGMTKFEELSQWDSFFASLPATASKKEKEALEREEAKIFVGAEWSTAIAQQLLSRFPKTTNNIYLENDSTGQYLKQFERWNGGRLLRRGEEIGLGKTIEMGREACTQLNDETVRLTSRERRRLERDAQLGEEAKLIFTLANVGMVTKTAQRAFEYPLRPIGVGLDDLIEEGMVGLTIAISKYDWRRGNKFSTMASPWIFRDISRYLHERAGPFKIRDENMVAFEKQYAKAASALEASQREHPEVEVSITDFLDSDALAIFRARTANSLNSPVKIVDGLSDDLELADIIPGASDTEDLAVESVDLAKRYERIQKGLGSLDEVTRQVIIMHYGLDGEGSRKKAQIERDLGIGPKTVNARIAKAEAVLRAAFGIQSNHESAIDHAPLSAAEASAQKHLEKALQRDPELAQVMDTLCDSDRFAAILRLGLDGQGQRSLAETGRLVAEFEGRDRPYTFEAMRVRLTYKVHNPINYLKGKPLKQISNRDAVPLSRAETEAKNRALVEHYRSKYPNLDEVLETLDENMRTAITLRWGLDYEGERTLSQIARHTKHQKTGRPYTPRGALKLVHRAEKIIREAHGLQPNE